MAALGITYNKTGAGDHVTNIKSNIWIIKERVHSNWSRLPFCKFVLESITAYLIKNVLMWLKYPPRKFGVSTKLIPHTIIFTLQYTQYLRVEFISYVQTHEDNQPTSSMNEITLGSICLGTTGNVQGTYIFYMLCSRKILIRTHWTLPTMTPKVMQRVIQIVTEKNQSGTTFWHLTKGNFGADWACLCSNYRIVWWRTSVNPG